MSRITVRLTEELKNEFQSNCDREGKSMTEVLKDFIKSFVSSYADDDSLPVEDELARSYAAMWNVRTDADRLAVSEAESHISNAIKLPKKVVRRRILKELDRRGYITVKAGMISLHVELTGPLEAGS